jgi:hypothetical protein
VLVVVWLEPVWLVLVLGKCWFSTSPTARNHQNEAAAKPPRERISALAMTLRLMAMTMIIIITQKLTYEHSTRLTSRQPVQAGRPGWQLLDVRLSLRR